MDNINTECERSVNESIKHMNDGYISKWNLNQNFYEHNYKRLRQVYPGKIVTIVGGTVRLIANDHADWKRKIRQLTDDERLEAYTIYVKRRDEVLVV